MVPGVFLGKKTNGGVHQSHFLRGKNSQPVVLETVGREHVDYKLGRFHQPPRKRVQRPVVHLKPTRAVQHFRPAPAGVAERQRPAEQHRQNLRPVLLEHVGGNHQVKPIGPVGQPPGGHEVILDQIAHVDGQRVEGWVGKVAVAGQHLENLIDLAFLVPGQKCSHYLIGHWVAQEAFFPKKFIGPNRSHRAGHGWGLVEY